MNRRQRSKVQVRRSPFSGRRGSRPPGRLSPSLRLELLEPRRLLAAEDWIGEEFLAAVDTSGTMDVEIASASARLPSSPADVAADRAPAGANQILVKLRDRATPDLWPMMLRGPATALVPGNAFYPLSEVLLTVGAASAEPVLPRLARAPVETGRWPALSVGEAEPAPKSGETAAREELGRWYRLELPLGADVQATLATLGGMAEVEAAETNLEWGLTDEIPPVIQGLPDATTDPAYDEQWHHDNAWTWKAWDHLNHNGIYPGGTQDVVVAVIDSGVDYNHEDLKSNMWVNPGEIPGNGIDDDGNGFVDDVHGASVVSNPNMHSGDPIDYHGHGTHVAGIIAAQAFNGKGGVGVAFNTRIMAVRAAQYSGVLTVDDIAEGILYAADNGAEVINMSFGGYSRSQIVEDALAVALNQAVLVAAAGNDSLPISEAPLYPAALPYVLGVEATTPDDTRAAFSNSGYEVRAPGVSIYSTLPGNQYAAWSGTSMATPVVSGVAALMRSYFWQREVWSSRFIMGSIAASGGVVDAYTALTEPPAPGVRLYETWLFDTPSIDPANDGDGRADSGETIHLGIELINRSGQANHVIAILDAIAPGASQPDPYVEILSNTVVLQGIGPFARDDNGLIYDDQGQITGVEAPFVVRIKPDAPNDHVIPFVLTIYFEDGWDPDPEVVMYERVDTFSYIVQRGRNLPSVISQDLTLEADDFWIVGGPVLVEPGVTLRVEPGAQVQWGAISSDPYNPGPKTGSLIVRGSLVVEGSAERPAVLFPSYLVSGQTTNISVDTGGSAKLKYAKIRNPNLTAITSADHVYFDWDANTLKIDVGEITNTIFHQLRGSGSISFARMDTSVFSAGRLNPPSGARISNSVFLQDNENNKRIVLTAPVSYHDRLTNNKGDLNTFYGARLMSNGDTYVTLPVEYTSLDLAETIARYYGGHVASAATIEEWAILESYLRTAPAFRAYGSGNSDQYFLGLSDREQTNQWQWLDGSELEYGNWAANQPAALSGTTKHIVRALYVTNNGATQDYRWYATNEQSSSRFGNGGIGSWNSFILRLPGEWSLEQLEGPSDDGRLLAFIKENYPVDVRQNALLSKFWEPSISRWMQVQTAAPADGHAILYDNYWGIDNTQLIDHMIYDYYDTFTTSRAEYKPAPSRGYESTWPFVESVLFNGVPAQTVPVLGAGPAVFTVTFNRDMDPAVQPFVTFGPSAPFTDFSVAPAGRNELLFTVTLSRASSRTVTVNYTTVDGTAVAGVDYTARWGTLKFEPGQTQQTIRVTLLGDHAAEQDKTLYVELAEPVEAELADADAQGTIVDDDPTVSIGDVAIWEGDAGVSDAVFTVGLEHAIDDPVTVEYRTVDGTGLAGVDYQAREGVLTFAAGQTQATIAIPVMGNSTPGQDRSFTVVLSHPTQINLGDVVGEAVIRDDDAWLSIGDAAVVEGDAGSVQMQFTVRLSAAYPKPVQVNYATADESAKVGEDYTAASGTLTFADGGPLEQPIVVTVAGDTVAELAETFRVELSAAVGAQIADGTGIGTILGDEGLLLSVQDATLGESNRWSQYLGGAAEDHVADVAVDVNGYVWVTGYTSSNTWVRGGYDTSFGGSWDAFVAKYAPDGQKLWSTFLGGSGDDRGWAIDTDAAGTAWVTGYTASSGWATGGFDSVLDGGVDAFLARLSPDGQLLAASYLGGTGSDRGRDVLVDAAGNVWVAGDTNSGSWPSGGFDTSHGGGWDGFLVKVTGAGQFLWSTYLGAAGDQFATALTTDSSGNALLAGYTQSSTWVTGGLDTSFNGGTYDAFVAKVAGDGQQQLWATYLGGGGDDEAAGIAMGIDGRIWIAGRTTSTALATSGAFDTTFGGAYDAFVAGLGGDGQSLLLASYLGGYGEDQANAIAVNAQGDVWVFGSTASRDWVSGGFDTVYGGGSNDAFAAKVSATGDRLWSSYVGDSWNDLGWGLTIDAEGSVWLVGATEKQGGGPGWVSADIDPLYRGGATDGYLMKLDDAAQWQARFTASLSAPPTAIVSVDYRTVPGTALAGDDYQTTAGTLTFSPAADAASYQATTEFSSTENPAGDRWSYRYRQGLVRDGSYALLDDGREIVPAVDAWYPAGEEQPSIGRNTSGAAYVYGSLNWPDGALMLHPGPDRLAVLSWLSPIAGAVDVSYRFADLNPSGTGGVKWYVELNNQNQTLAEGALAEGGQTAAGLLLIPNVAVQAGDRINLIVDPNGSFGGDSTLVQATVAHAAVAAQTQRTIAVPVAADVRHEAEEQFFVELTNGSVAIQRHRGQGTIVDNDPTITIDDVEVIEGDSGSPVARFTVTLSQTPARQVAAKYATEAGTASPGEDFVPVSGELVFAAGSAMQQTVDVPLLPDAQDEDHETLTVRLFDVVNAEPIRESGTALILDDDDPALSIDDVAVTERDSGIATATFTVTLASPPVQTVTVDYATQDASAVAGEDFWPTSGTLTFAVGGPLSLPVTVSVRGERVDETDEMFLVRLSNADGAVIARAEGIGTIRDDEPRITVDGVQILEGDSGSGTALVTVRLSAEPQQSVTVDFATRDGTATAGEDYTSVSGTLTFLPGQGVQQTIPISVQGDTSIETNETILVELSNATGGTLDAVQAIVTIVGDDGPLLSVADAQLVEGQSGTTYLQFTVTLSAAIAADVQVDYATSDGTARAGGDYQSAAGTLLFPAGPASQQTFLVPVLGDRLHEGDEAFFVDLSNATQVGISRSRGVGTILDDDPVLSIGDAALTEGDSGNPQLGLTVTISQEPLAPVTVDWATADGSATAGADYLAANGTLTFTPGGPLQQQVSVYLIGDLANEIDETFTVNLSGATGSAAEPYADPQGVGTILDDDGPKLVIEDAVLVEGDAGQAEMQFIVRLTEAAGHAVQVGYATEALTAQSGVDFAATSGTVSFAVGETEQQIAVPVFGDLVDETDEQFRVVLTGASGVPHLRTRAVGTIQDDDTAVLTIADATAAEGFQGWMNSRIWQGSFWITPMTGESYHEMRISGAVAADDPWLVSGYDVGRFRFQVKTMGVAAMTLQATGQEGSIRLSWAQDDFDLLAGYHLYRSTSATGTYTRLNGTIIPVGSESFVDTNVSPAVPMYYKFSVVQTDMTESDPSNVASAAALDTISPVITHTPKTSAVPGSGLRLTATVTDNVAVEGVAIHYRPLGGTQAYVSLPMINVSGTSWSATIPGTAVQPPGVDYYLTARDELNTVYHGTAAAPHSVIVTAAPSLTSVSPNQGSVDGGLRVTLSGSQFQAGAGVEFGGVPATDVVVQTSGQILCTTPAHFPSLVDVRVVNPDSSETTLLNGFLYVDDDAVLSLPTMSADHGAILEIPISLAQVDGLRAAQLTVTFDAAVLRILSVSTGSLTSGWALEANTATAGRVTLTLAGGTASSGSGTLAKLNVEVIGAIASQTALSLSNVLLNDGAIEPDLSNGLFAVNGFFALSGSVKYFQANRPVPGAELELVGVGAQSASSDAAGAFSFPAVQTGAHTLTPDKADQVVDITAYDASLILQAAAGKLTLTANQILAADVNRNNAVTSMDASYVLEKSVGLMTGPFPGAGTSWLFSPAERSYSLLNGNLAAQDFTAILLGDVSGDWDGVLNGGGEPEGAQVLDDPQPSSVALTLPDVVWTGGGTVEVPLQIARGGADVHALDLRLAYDASQLSQPVVTAGDPANGTSWLANTSQPGVIRIGMASGSPLPQDGDLLTFSFQVTGSLATPAPVSLQMASLDEGAVATVLDSGYVADATPPAVTVEERWTKNTAPPLSGTVDDALAAVSVTVAGKTYAATNRGDGTWFLSANTISPPLADGAYDVQVQAWDVLSRLGVDATANELTIDTRAPVPSGLTPTDSTLGVPFHPQLNATFGELIRKGAGTIVLKRADDGSVVETIDAAGAAVSVSGATATIQPSVTLLDSTAYYVEVASGAFLDLAGNESPAIAGAADWTFTTRGALVVESFQPTATGFVAQFTSDLESSVLNLYDQGGDWGPADVRVVGAATGPVRGTLVVGPGLRQITFLATSGVLPPDDYQVTFISGATGLHDTAAKLLDGDANGTVGDNFVTALAVPSPPSGAMVVGLPNVTRGYGQPVNVPANNLAAGLPLTISNGVGVSRVELQLHYDPALLEILAFSANEALAGGQAEAALTFPATGVAALSITAPSSFAAAAGPLTIGSFTARVPDNAPYGGKHILDIADLHVYDTAMPPAELPSIDDDAIHVAAFLGDTNGDGRYTSQDTSLLRRIIGQVNTGFSILQTVDPVLLADITHNGFIQSNDTTSIRRAIGLVAVPNIPALPTGLPVPPASGADPRVYIPRDLAGAPGETLTVPVVIEVTEAAGVTIGGFDLILEYDADKFTVSQAKLGDLFLGTDVSGTMTQPAPGQLIYTADSLVGTSRFPAGTVGDLLTLTVAIGAGAAPGPAAWNLLASLGPSRTGVYDAALAELVLHPPLTNASGDAGDGLLLIDDGRSAWHNPVDGLDVNGDGLVTPLDAVIVINRLNAEAAGEAPASAAYYYDVNDDSFCTAQDVLIVINHLNAQSLPAAEGESRDFLPPSEPAKTTSASVLPASLFDDASPEWSALEAVLDDLADDIASVNPFKR
jgi:subtilisin family serine protease